MHHIQCSVVAPKEFELDIDYQMLWSVVILYTTAGPILQHVESFPMSKLCTIPL